MAAESPHLFNIALTPAGVLYAFSQQVPDATQAKLQSILASKSLPRVDVWLNQDADQASFLEGAHSAGWVQRVQRELSAPDVKLDEFLSHVIAGLSGERRVALASAGGFCIGHSGYSLEEAEALCVAAADFTEFAGRQRARGWQGASRMASFHEDVTMLMPTTSFVPFWVDGNDYCLVIAGEPLLNNPVFVELVWGIQTAGNRFLK
ncbi:MAG TPA: hypothetical protein PKC80_05720 [Burkholderiaceae bacterium]|nr:hypothetical protein [Burkholderiaceae bacterium]